MKVIKVVNLKRFMPESPSLRSEGSQGRISNCNSISLDTNTRDNPYSIKTKHTSNQTTSGCNINNAHHNAGDEEVIPNNLCNYLDSTQYKFINNSRSKIQFKSCLHTTEDLTKLTEHCDGTLVKVGDIFDSRESFRQYLNDNAKRWHYYYVCRNSKKRIIEYNCICMAYSLKPKEVVIRRRKKRITACPCKLRLTVDEGTKKVIVYYVCNHHDHALTEAAFYHYPHTKYLPQHVKDEFLDLAYLGLDSDLIQKYILSLVGLKVKRKDIWSYAYKFKRKIYERSLTVERQKYMKDLISRIRDTFAESPDILSDAYLDDESEIKAEKKLYITEHPQQRKVSSITENESKTLMHTATLNDDMSKNGNKSKDTCFEDVLSVNYVDDRNTDVIVHYIDEKGILCDKNGTPVTNSSAIFQFIHNYEYVMPEVNVKAEQFLEERTVISERVESIDDDVIPFHWDSIWEAKPTIERTCKAYNESRVDDTTGLILTDNEIVQELSVNTTESEQRTENVISETIFNNAVENFKKSLSPTHETPALYAEIENFKKYYFVDHQYVKYGEDKCKSQQNIQEGLSTLIEAICEEYIKGIGFYTLTPEFVNYPTYLKYCSAHENLLQLTDPDAIQAGAKFLTHEVFITYINERANRWFFYYSLVESGKSPEYYVYKCVYGKHRVSKNAYRAKGLRKRVKHTTECPCQIRLRRLESAPGYLTVLYSCNHHDHALDEQLFTAQPHSRRLPEHIKEELKDLLSLGVSFDVLRKHVKSETGLQMYGKYFHNVRMKMRRDNEDRRFTDERLRVLTKKSRDLEAIYGSKSKKKTQNKNKKRRRSAQKYIELDGMDYIAQEVNIVEADRCLLCVAYITQMSDDSAS